MVHATSPASITRRASKLTLWNDGKGNYVNRYGANGEQWNITTPANYCGTVADAMLDADGNPIPCTFKYQYDPDTNPTGGKTDCQKMEDLGYTQLPGSCHSDNGTYVALYITAKVDGNPLFFPVDKDTFTPASELHVRPDSPLLRRGEDLALRRRCQRQQDPAQLQLHERGPLLVPVRQEQVLHPRLRR